MPQALKTCEGGRRRVDSPGPAMVFSRPFKTVTSGEIGLDAGAEGATAPETLRQTDRVIG